MLKFLSKRINSPSASILLVSILLGVSAVERNGVTVARRGLRSTVGNAGGPPIKDLPKSGVTTLPWMKVQRLVLSPPTKG